MRKRKPKIRDDFIKVGPDKLEPVEPTAELKRAIEDEKEKLRWARFRGKVLRWIDLLIEIWRRLRRGRPLEDRIKDWLKIVSEILAKLAGLIRR